MEQEEYILGDSLLIEKESKNLQERSMNQENYFILEECQVGDKGNHKEGSLNGEAVEGSNPHTAHDLSASQFGWELSGDGLGREN
ncbi:hypothetical protein [Bacillus piscicola]|uniref:hypothetical protein n=1 Tax=Bacillus piscicola TaxID=1632684 RepID=UPI001F08E5CD|nr:hypothetical protein [Bacillus piscicola]